MLSAQARWQWQAVRPRSPWTGTGTDPPPATRLPSRPAAGQRDALMPGWLGQSLRRTCKLAATIDDRSASRRRPSVPCPIEQCTPRTSLSLSHSATSLQPITQQLLYIRIKSIFRSPDLRRPHRHRSRRMATPDGMHAQARAQRTNAHGCHAAARDGLGVGDPGACLPRDRSIPRYQSVYHHCHCHHLRRWMLDGHGTHGPRGARPHACAIGSVPQIWQVATAVCRGVAGAGGRLCLRRAPARFIWACMHAR